MNNRFKMSRVLSWPRAPGLWRWGAILVASMVSLVAGSPYLAHRSPFSPLFTFGLLLVPIICLMILKNPPLALYAALFMLVIPPGIIPGDLHLLFTRFFTLAALGTWALEMIAQRRPMVWTSTMLLMLVFLGWSTATLLWASNLSVAIDTLITYILRFALCLVLISNEITTKKTLSGLMHTLALSGWLFVLIGIGTVLLGDYQIGTRLQILGGNENTLGGLFPLVVPAVLWQANRDEERVGLIHRLLGIVFIAASLLLVALSGSRGSAIAWTVTVTGFVLWRRTRFWGVVGLLMLATAAIAAPLLFYTTLGRFGVHPGDTALGGREAIWQAALLVIREHLWLGTGVGNAPYEVMPHLRELRSVWQYEWAAIHNPLLAVLADTGLPGLFLYTGVLISAIWSFIRQWRRHHEIGLVGLGGYFPLVASACAGYLSDWIKGGGAETNITYFLMLALLLIPAQWNRQEWGRQTAHNKIISSADRELWTAVGG